MIDVYKNFVFLFIFLILSVTVSVIDIRTKIIPDWIVITGIILLTGFRIIFFGDLLSIISLKIITGPLLFLTVYFLTQRKLGIGDIKYSALIGVFVGLPGLFVTIGLASIMGLIFAVIGLAIGNIHLKTKIPFAPFLTLGSFLTFFIFNPIF